MRTQILKLQRNKSTKAERRFMEMLKRNRIPFHAKVRVADREIDFLIGTLAIEIDGHDQDPTKNKLLLELGYTPIHFHNSDLQQPTLIEQEIISLWQDSFQQN